MYMCVCVCVNMCECVCVLSVPLCVSVSLCILGCRFEIASHSVGVRVIFMFTMTRALSVGRGDNVVISVHPSLPENPSLRSTPPWHPLPPSTSR